MLHSSAMKVQQFRNPKDDDPNENARLELGAACRDPGQENYYLQPTRLSASIDIMYALPLDQTIGAADPGGSRLYKDDISALLEQAGMGAHVVPQTSCGLFE